MLRRIDYECEHTPTDNEIIEAMQIAQEKNYIVRLNWFVKYNGWYRLSVTPTITFDECKSALPKVYGL